MKNVWKKLAVLSALATWIVFASTASAQINVDAQGEVGINTPLPTARLHITQSSTSISAGYKLTGAASNGQDWYFYMDANDNFKIRDDASDVMIFQNGTDFVGINTSAPTANLSVNGTANKTGGGSWAVFSDRRIKRDVTPYSDGLAEVMRIQPVRFKYTGEFAMKDDPNREFVGIIAQDMQEIAPYMVESVTYQAPVSLTAEGDDPDAAMEKLASSPQLQDGQEILSYDPSALNYMLVNAIQEQQREIQAQKQENAELLRRIEALEAKIGR